MRQPLPIFIRNDRPKDEMDLKTGEIIEANASYFYLNRFEEIHVEKLQEKVLQEFPKVNGVPLGFNRNPDEMRIEYSKWLHSGAFTFSVGPKTAENITRRLKEKDIPTAPVPIAYFQFPENKWKFDKNKELQGAHISRGRNGKITFIEDETPKILNPTVIALPSVFRAKDLEILKRKLEVHRKPKISEQTLLMAKAMVANEIGVEPDAKHIEAIAIHMESLNISSLDQKAKNPQLDISGMISSIMLGPLNGNPGPLLMRAAQIVLIAADEARKFDKEYGELEYINTNMAARENTEGRHYPVKRREGVVQLP